MEKEISDNTETNVVGYEQENEKGAEQCDIAWMEKQREGWRENNSASIRCRNNERGVRSTQMKEWKQ